MAAPRHHAAPSGRHARCRRGLSARLLRLSAVGRVGHRRGRTHRVISPVVGARPRPARTSPRRCPVPGTPVRGRAHVLHESPHRRAARRRRCPRTHPGRSVRRAPAPPPCRLRFPAPVRRGRCHRRGRLLSRRRPGLSRSARHVPSRGRRLCQRLSPQPPGRRGPQRSGHPLHRRRRGCRGRPRVPADRRALSLESPRGTRLLALGLVGLSRPPLRRCGAPV